MAAAGGELRIHSEIKMELITEFFYSIQPGCQGICLTRGISNKEMAEQLEAIGGRLPEATVERRTSNGEAETLFAGRITAYTIGVTNGLYTMSLRIESSDLLLRQKKSSRFFQDGGLTYQEVSRFVLKATQGASGMWAQGGDRTIESPLLQYEESDYDFLKRLAGRQDLPLYPDYRSGRIGLLFGIRTGRVAEEAEETGRGICGGNKRTGNKKLAKGEGIYYTFRSGTSYEIGDVLLTEHGALPVIKKSCRMKGSVLTYWYEAGGKGCLPALSKDFPRICGLELTGTAGERRGESLQFYADVEELGGGKREWDYTPVSGNLHYTMPEAGSLVRLGFGTEREASIIGAIRGAGELPGEQKRTYRAAGGKQLRLEEQEVSLTGQGGSLLVKEESAVEIAGQGTIQITAADSVCLEGKTIFLQTPQEINLYHSPMRSAQRGDRIGARGTKSNPPTGGDSSMTLNNMLSLGSKSLTLAGTEYIRFKPYSDDPEKGTDWYNILEDTRFGLIVVLVAVGGLVYVGSVVASGGTTLGALPHVISGMTFLASSIGAIDVLETTRADVARGYSSGPETYILNGAKGVMKGVLVGARFYIVPYAAEMVVSDILGSYIVGVNVGGTILSAEEMIKAVAIGGYGLNATDLSFMINDGVAELTGYNAGKNVFGGKYEDAREVVRFGSNMMLSVGLLNPRLYQDMSTGNMQEIRWYKGGKESVGDKGGSGASGISKETELFMPDDAYNKQLPKFTTPGTKSLPKYDEWGNLKQIKYYDNYGREIGWIDYTNHGYPGNHTIPHWHEVQWNAQYPIGGYQIDHRMDTRPPFPN